MAATSLWDAPVRSRRRFICTIALAVITLLLCASFIGQDGGKAARTLIDHVAHDANPADNKPDDKPQGPPKQYIAEPEWSPPPIRDPFAKLEPFLPLPIPEWNRPKKGLHKDHGIPYAPPLFFGFTRTWPVLLQAVVSYITAGWPPEQIYVIENTGTHDANARGLLTLQNPFYLNHKHLKMLGVNIIEAPVRMSFSQLQNFFMYLSRTNDWPLYFWGHMDILALSYEDGFEGLTPPAGEEGYKSLYTLALEVMSKAMKSDDRWATKFFAYDSLTLVNRKAYEDVGGWDSMIPFYINDCDFHARLHMRNWTTIDVHAGIITDVSAVLDDLRALYRVPGVEAKFTDPNPPPPKPENEAKNPKHRRRDEPPNTDREKWIKLRDIANNMFHYKHGNRGRNTWQLGQHGGQGEPYYYHSRGIAEAIDVQTEAGKEVFRRKWGHRDCDLIQTGRVFEDQWLLEKDW